MESDKRNRRVSPLTLHDLHCFFAVFGWVVGPIRFYSVTFEICSIPNASVVRYRAVEIDL